MEPFDEKGKIRYGEVQFSFLFFIFFPSMRKQSMGAAAFLAALVLLGAGCASSQPSSSGTSSQTGNTKTSESPSSGTTVSGKPAVPSANQSLDELTKGLEGMNASVQSLDQAGAEL